MPAELRTALIVEDMPLNQEILDDFMTSQGYTCTIAEDGLVAVDKYFEQPFSVVLLDLHMPRFSGFDFLNAIARADPACRKQKVVVISGDSDAVDESDFGDWPNLKALHKPINLDDLSAILSQQADAA